MPAPDPAREDTRDNAYVFERRVTFRHGDGSASAGRIDCYKRRSYVLEAKKIKLNAATKGFDDAMQRARGQAESYARALPADEGRPPFLIVVDVGHVIELYADFTCSGATYTPFPDARSHRIKLNDLNDETIRERLTTLWLDPRTLDPTRASAKVTREIAEHLAKIAKTLEGAGHHPELVAGFLTRCLFSMFAEDVGLLPRQNGKGTFVTLLKTLQGNPQQFVPLLAALWREMDVGGFSVVLREILPRFNGKLFKQPEVIPLDRDQIGLLIEAAQADWQAAHAALTLTGMYNVREKLCSAEAQNAKEKAIHEQGLVSVLKSLHDELDAAVLAAYGWSDLAPQLANPAQKEAASETLLVRLVALNAERAAEEVQGQVRWLRPEYQHPTQAPQQTEIALDDADSAESTDAVGRVSDSVTRQTKAESRATAAPWPATLPEQVAAVARVLAAAPIPLTESTLAARFTGKGPRKKRLPQIIETLVALGRVRRDAELLIIVG